MLFLCYIFYPFLLLFMPFQTLIQILTPSLKAPILRIITKQVLC